MRLVVKDLERQNLAVHMGRKHRHRSLVRYMPFTVFAARLKVERTLQFR